MKKLLILTMVFVLTASLCACSLPLDKIFQTKPHQTGATEETGSGEPEETPAENPVEAAEPVKTVIDYTREIVPQGGTTILTHHYVKCPALTAETEDAKVINKEIYDVCAKAVDTLESFAEEDYIYTLSYQAFSYGGAVALIMDLSVSNHYGSVFPAHKVYYYDTATGKQLTYEQYRDALGFTEEQLRQVLATDSWVGSMEYDILWAAVDGEKTGIMAKSPEFMDDTCLFILETSVVN